jgi:CHAT domain-containing protein
MRSGFRGQRGFALWDGLLTVTDLAAQPTERRDLAFLSACQTATGSVRHLDEAIHLAAAMQFLGYRQVIATMWTIADSLAPRVADAVYAQLTRHGSPDRARAAAALHHALRSVRQEDRTNNPCSGRPISTSATDAADPGLSAGVNRHAH